MSEAEYKMLRTKNTLEAEEAMKFADANESEGDQNGGTQAMRKTNDGGKRIGVKDKVQFKRKKAKVLIHDIIFLFPSCYLHSHLVAFVSLLPGVITLEYPLGFARKACHPMC